MSRERGVTYLALLLAIALVSAVLASTATVWSHAQRREREKQLMWAGDQFRRALMAYSRFGNGTYPRKLEDLLEDSRSPAKRRYLRQIYEDPMTRGTDWGLIRNLQGGIIGVYSRYEGAPIRKAQFPAEYDKFERAVTYADWKFAATKPPVEEATPAKPGANPSDKPPSPGAAPASDAPPPRSTEQPRADATAATPPQPGAPAPSAAAASDAPAHKPLAIPREAVIATPQPLHRSDFAPKAVTP